MSRGRAYWSGLERPIAWCSVPGCRARGARTGKDGRRLCPDHRKAAKQAAAKEQNQSSPPSEPS